jgi:hypothetical protein
MDKAESDYLTSPPVPPPKPTFLKAMALPYSPVLDKVITTQPKREIQPTFGAVGRKK